MHGTVCADARKGQALEVARSCWHSVGRCEYVMSVVTIGDRRKVAARVGINCAVGLTCAHLLSLLSPWRLRLSR
jgi:hypothetical protein